MIQQKIANAIKVEIKKTPLKRLASVYTWQTDDTQLKLYNMGDELILAIPLQQEWKIEIENQPMTQVLGDVFSQLARENYLTLENVQAPEEVLIEDFSMEMNQ